MGLAKREGKRDAEEGPRTVEEVVIADIGLSLGELNQLDAPVAEIFAVEPFQVKFRATTVPEHGAFFARLLHGRSISGGGSSLKADVPAKDQDPLERLREEEDELVRISEDWWLELRSTSEKEVSAFLSFGSLANGLLRCFVSPPPASEPDASARVTLTTSTDLLEPNIRRLGARYHTLPLEMLRSAVEGPHLGPWVPVQGPQVAPSSGPGALERNELLPFQAATADFMARVEGFGGDAIPPAQPLRYGDREICPTGDERIVSGSDAGSGVRAGLHPEAAHSVEPPSGGLIAHPVGSGKTVIAVELVRRRGGRTLVICPDHIQHQWREVVHTFAPHVRVSAPFTREENGEPEESDDDVSRSDMVIVGVECLADSFPDSARAWNIVCGERWHRAVFDEPQEIVQAEYCRQLVRSLRTENRWGLTATPESRFYGIMCLLWGRELGRREYRRLRASWAEKRARRDPRAMCMEGVLPGVRSNMLSIDLSEGEQAVVDLYRRAGHKIDRVIRMCGLPEGWDEDSEAGSAFVSVDEWAEDAKRSVEAKLERANRRLAGVKEALGEALSQEEAVWRAAEIGWQDASDDDDDEEVANEGGRAILEEGGTPEELREEERSWDRERTRQEANLGQVERTRRALSSSQGAECAVCLESMAGKPVAILKCLHAFDGKCVGRLAPSLAGSGVACPLCREITGRGEMVTLLSGSPKGEGAQGSKLPALASLLDRILNDDPNERVVVFAQFPGILAAVAKHLENLGIEAFALLGNSRNRQRILRQFQRPGQGPRVLLLSYQRGASGLNLDIARHVVILHPFCKPNSSSVEHVPLSDALAYEVQAVGRVLRYPQRKEVWVHRLYARKTVEAELYSAWGWKAPEDGEQSRHDRWPPPRATS